MQILKLHAMNFSKDTPNCSQDTIKYYHRDFQHQPVQLGKPYILILKSGFCNTRNLSSHGCSFGETYCLCRTQYLSAGTAPAAFLKQYSKPKNRLID